MSSQLSPICQKIENEIKGLDQERDSLQEELQHAAPGQKASLVAQIKALNTQITKKNKELADCIKKNPFIPPPQPKPNPCKSIAQEVIKLENALNNEVHDAVADLQEELQHAAPGEKPGLVAQIKKISSDIRKNSKIAKQIAAKQKEYADCIQKNGGLSALSATFKGTATMLTSNSNAPGPFKQGVTIGLEFSDWDHRDIWISSFPPISVTYDVGFPVGQVTTTVSLNSGTGTFDPPSNTITLKLSLFFHHSTSLAGDSTLDITLSTTSLLTAAGKITVNGSSKFKGGYLGGDTCWLTVEGTISPHP